MLWKYAKPKQKPKYDLYLRLPEGKQKAISIRGWKFEKAPNGSLFKCEVIIEDGQPVDKFWSVWDYDLTEALKKRLKGKKAVKDTVELRVTRKSQDEEDSFELE